MTTDSAAFSHGGTELCVIIVGKLPAPDGLERLWSFSETIFDYASPENAVTLRAGDGASITVLRNSGSPMVTKSTPPDTPCVMMWVFDGSTVTIYVDEVARLDGYVSGNKPDVPLQPVQRYGWLL
jgi:hypothetical protein